MKIPKRLKVGGQVIEIESSKELPGVNGDFSAAKNLIRICKTLPQSQKEVTLFHELLHALNSEMSTTHVGHMLLESLSQQLYQVLKDNHLLR
jgi:hypothetical protein